MIHRNQVQGLSALAAVSLLLMGLAHGLVPAQSKVMVWVLAWVSVESLAAFYAVSWALPRAGPVFYSVFFGGIFLRLASIGAIAYILSALHVPVVVPLLALVFGYFLLSMVQLPFYSYGFR